MILLKKGVSMNSVNVITVPETNLGVLPVIRPPISLNPYDPKHHAQFADTAQYEIARAIETNPEAAESIQSLKEGFTTHLHLKGFVPHSEEKFYYEFVIAGIGGLFGTIYGYRVEYS